MYFSDLLKLIHGEIKINSIEAHCEMEKIAEEMQVTSFPLDDATIRKWIYLGILPRKENIPVIIKYLYRRIYALGKREDVMNLILKNSGSYPKELIKRLSSYNIEHFEEFFNDVLSTSYELQKINDLNLSDSKTFEKKYLNMLEYDLSYWRGLGLKRDILLEDIFIHRSLEDMVNKTVLPDNELLDACLSGKDRKNIMIWGSAGSGKSTLLCWWCLETVKKNNAADIKRSEKNTKVPIYIRLSLLDRFYIKNKNWGTTLPEAVAYYYKSILGEEQTRKYIEELISSGRAVILFDAADEVALGMRSNVSIWLKRICSAAKCPVIISSRPTVEFLKGFTGFNNYHIQDFNFEQQSTLFIKNWFKAAPYQSDTIIEYINKPENASIKNMSFNPLYLTMMCIEYENGNRISRNPGLLFLEFVRILLKYWDEMKDVSIYGDERTRDEIMDLEINTLALIAYRFEDDSEELSENGIYSELEDYFSKKGFKENYKNIISRIEERSGIIQREYAGYVRFCHKLFHDFFYAVNLINLQRSGKIGREDIYSKYGFNEKYLDINRFYKNLTEAGF